MFSPLNSLARHYNPIIRGIFYLLSICFLGGCTTQTRKASIDIVKSIGYQKILAEASVLRENVHADTLVVSLQKWPESFQLLNPLQVHYNPHGFKLLMTKFIGQEQGLFIVTELGYEFPVHDKITYEKVAKGIYWYEDYRE